MTISEGLNLLERAQSRKKSLTQLRDQVSVTEIWHDNSNKEKRPEYDVKTLDEIITSLELAIFNINNAIKTANAQTEIDIDNEVAIKVDIFQPLS